MLSKIFAAQTNGLIPHIITIEVDISRGMHIFSIVGLPDKVVEESRDRITSALAHSGWENPRKSGRRIIISLAPAALKKEGAVCDVAIAIGILISAQKIRCSTKKRIFLGELALNGDLRPIRGSLLIAKYAREQGFNEIFLPYENAKEAALVKDINIFGARHLNEILSHIIPLQHHDAPTPRITLVPQKHKIPRPQNKKQNVDLATIIGQQHAKRAIEIAAAGQHNVALIGPPGTGKTLLARALPSILPPLSPEEIQEVTGIHSAAGRLNDAPLTTAPFESPHHTSSYAAIIGGGVVPKPGAVTLAHRGVLFLDEFPEFESRVIESLRQPLEDRIVTVARATQSVTFPANFLLVAAMNPCPCGNSGKEGKECICAPHHLFRYRRKISGPIADRIDLWVWVPDVPLRELSRATPQESSRRVQKRVVRARRRLKQWRRKNKTILRQPDAVPIKEKMRDKFIEAAKSLHLSPRRYHRTLSVAHTIACLEGCLNIEEAHLFEALHYSKKDEER